MNKELSKDPTEFYNKIQVLTDEEIQKFNLELKERIRRTLILSKYKIENFLNSGLNREQQNLLLIVFFALINAFDKVKFEDEFSNSVNNEFRLVYYQGFSVSGVLKKINQRREQIKKGTLVYNNNLFSLDSDVLLFSDYKKLLRFYTNQIFILYIEDYLMKNEPKATDIVLDVLKLFRSVNSFPYLPIDVNPLCEDVSSEDILDQNQLILENTFKLENYSAFNFLKTILNFKGDQEFDNKKIAEILGQLRGQNPETLRVAYSSKDTKLTPQEKLKRLEALKKILLDLKLDEIAEKLNFEIRNVR